MIEAHSLTKRYGAKTAVDGIDFTVRPGAVTEGGAYRTPRLADIDLVKRALGGRARGTDAGPA